MALHHLRSRLATETLVGTFVGIDSPTVVETLGGSGFAFLCFDGEHSPMTVASIENMLRASDLVGMPAIIRIPEVGPFIGRVLDAGAAGILAPRIETAADAAEAVARCRYAPDGYRGLGPGRAGYRAGGIAEYISETNASILVTIQIETKAGLENADAILATPGIDAVVVGPADLAASLGVAIGSDEHSAAIAEIFAAAERNGVARGAFCFSPEDAALKVSNGATFVIVGADSMFLAGGATAMADVTRSLIADTTALVGGTR